jgi:hypothetical protein
LQLHQSYWVSLGQHLEAQLIDPTISISTLLHSFYDCRTGAISSEQLKQAPIKLLAAIGLIEALSQVSGFIGASKLPGELDSSERTMKRLFKSSTEPC